LPLALAAAGLLGCGGPKVPLPTENRPGWIDKGSGFFEGSAFYGVGGVSGVSLPSLRRNSADAAARADLARIFHTYVADLLKIYSSSEIANGTSEDQVEQLAGQATEVFTEMELPGALIVDRYYDEKEQTQYSLAKLDVEGFKRNAMQMKSLNDLFKDSVQKNAENWFRELDSRKALRPR
jgi:hypothetical protein